MQKWAIGEVAETEIGKNALEPLKKLKLFFFLREQSLENFETLEQY